MPAQNRQGKFITFEGGEGTGKSTQVKILAATLEKLDKEVVLTREPGGSEGAEQIRQLLVEGDTARWDGETEVLLHFAARRDHLVKTVWPALAQSKWVISDRFADSTIAYQGYGHSLDLEFIKSIHQTSIDGFKPDLTLILDLPADTGLSRAQDRELTLEEGEDRYERMGGDFHQRLKQGFLEIARKEPDRCVVVNAKGSIEEVAQRVMGVVAQKFDLNFS
ncbi:MAG: dTMP kinase [Rhodospirillales bacterium]|nr:dTMP kinase [Rhodospirillales bacterium]